MFWVGPELELEAPAKNKFFVVRSGVICYDILRQTEEVNNITTVIVGSYSRLTDTCRWRIVLTYFHAPKFGCQVINSCKIVVILKIVRHNFSDPCMRQDTGTKNYLGVLGCSLPPS